MPAAHLKGQSCTGHGCFPPRPSVQGSSNVRINGIPVVRQGDMFAVHSCDTSHSGALAKGSSTVRVNGKQVARVGDPVSCGSACLEGSPNVFIGG